MKPFDFIRVASGNIARQKLRSSLTIFAVVIGATSVTVMLALVTGAKGFVKNQFEQSGTLQQIVVTQQTDLDYDKARFGGGKSDSNGLKLNDDLVNKVKAVPHVTAVTPQTNVWVLDALKYNDKKLAVDNVVAYDPVGVIKQNVLAGRDLQPNDGKGTVTLTDKYAEKLGFGNDYKGLVGKTVTLQTNSQYTGEGATIVDPSTMQNNGPGSATPPPPQQTPTDIQATVVGVVSASDSGDAVINVTMTWAKDLLVQRRYEMTEADRKAMAEEQRIMQQQMQGRPGGAPPAPSKPHMTLVTSSGLDQNGYQTIVAKVDTTSNVEAAAASIRTLGVGAATAKSMVNQQMTVFNIIGLVLGGIGGIALGVAAIGVVNTMIMAILERTREIGVMRACGATRNAVRSLFTLEAGMLGFWGGVVGLLIGYGLTRIANVVLNDQLKNNGIASANIITLPPWLILSVLLATTGIGVLAGLYPANRAARLNPVEALRYE